MKAERVVVDTNVLISAALSRNSTPAKLMSLVLDKYRLVFSRETFDELETRLWRPKFDPYLSTESRRRLLHDFVAVSDWITLESGMPAYCRDADDDKFIHAALTCAASWLVSGDRDLLALPPINRLRILSPADALCELAE